MIDSHSHIYMDRYRDDRDAVIARAATAGVTQLLQVGCDLEESRTVVALSAHVSGIYAAVGVHPHQATTVGPDVLDALEGKAPLDGIPELAPRLRRSRSVRERGMKIL